MHAGRDMSWKIKQTARRRDTRKHRPPEHQIFIILNTFYYHLTSNSHCAFCSILIATQALDNDLLFQKHTKGC